MLKITIERPKLGSEPNLVEGGVEALIWYVAFSGREWVNSSPNESECNWLLRIFPFSFNCWTQVLLPQCILLIYLHFLGLYSCWQWEHDSLSSVMFFFLKSIAHLSSSTIMFNEGVWWDILVSFFMAYYSVLHILSNWSIHNIFLV